MRIIAGDLRGYRLETPEDRRVRPTTDMAKEGLFNIIAAQLEDAAVCDLFAGTGNLGLEALSRGARICYFADNSRDSISLIKKNVAICKLQDRAQVIYGDYRSVLSRMPEKADIYFLDPPYDMDLWEDAITMIGEKELLADGGMIIAEHNRKKELPGEISSLEKIKERRYGTVVLSFYM